MGRLSLIGDLSGTTGILLSILLMLMMLPIVRKLIFSMPSGDAMAIERLARAFLSLGLLTGASLVGAIGVAWQAWACVFFFSAAAVFGLIAFLQRRGIVGGGSNGSNA